MSELFKQKILSKFITNDTKLLYVDGVLGLYLYNTENQHRYKLLSNQEEISLFNEAFMMSENEDDLEDNIIIIFRRIK